MDKVKSLLFVIFIIVLLSFSSGCTVALSPLALKEQTLYHEGKFEEAREYLEEERGRLSPAERRRIVNENIYRIKRNESVTMEFVKYRMGHEYLAKSLIELGQFDRAVRVCEDGIAESQMLADLFERTRYSYVSTKEHNVQVYSDLMRLKGYAVWFKTGNKGAAKKYFNGWAEHKEEERKNIPYLDLLEKQKIEFLLDNGYFYDKILGQYEEALKYLWEVVSMSEKLTLLDIDKKYGYCMQAYLKIMGINMKLGKLEEAQRTLDKYAAITDDLTFKLGRVGASTNSIFRGYLAIMDAQAGALFALARDFTKSKQFFDRSSKTINSISEESQDMWDLKAKGTYYVLYGTYYCGMQKQIKEAIENTDKGLSYLRPYYLTSVMDEVNIENAYIFSGELHYKNGNYEMARRKAMQALEHSERMHNKIAGANALTLLGQAYFAEDRRGEAKETYERALRLLDGNESTENWRLYFGLGQTNEYFGNQKKALEFYLRAVDEVEKLWTGRFKNTQKQVSFIDERLIVFDPVIRSLHSKGKSEKEKALFFMERSKARTFFDSSNVIFEESSEKKRARNFDNSLLEVKKALPPRTVVLEYYVGERSVYVAVITKKELYMEALAGVTLDELQKDVIAMKFGIESRDGQYEKRAAELYSILVKPLTKYFGGCDTICIIPHGVLHYLPFQALLVDVRSKTFLIDAYKIFYAPSIAILDTLYKSNRNRKEKLLAVGNSLEVDIRALGIGRDKLGSLPYVKSEAEEVAALFNTKDSAVVVDDDATETRIRASSPHFDILLFSSHAVLPMAEPLKSCIILTKDSENDGRLTVSEIERLNIQANLVVLSACESGIVVNYEGAIDPYKARFPYGDDLVGLQRVFMKAGSSSVLSTLWPVNDAATKALIVAFFKKYKGGMDKAQSLREAELMVKANKQWEHPYYWASFVLSGDWR